MANLYANICQVGKQADMRECFEMITHRPAQLWGLKNYGLAVENSADLVVLDAQPSPNLRQYFTRSSAAEKRCLASRQSCTLPTDIA
jgi:cytosine/adenosine deaminase-related metal-dependent hydrolase